MAEFSINHLLVVVDESDLENIIPLRKWHILRAGHTNYVVSNRGEYLHRFIMNPPKNLIVDHIDHNGLNNSRKNLKVCTKSENQKNVRTYKKIGNRGILQKGLL